MEAMSLKELPSFDPSSYAPEYVLLAFRRTNELQDGDSEHYLNRWAAAWTRLPDDQPPGGCFCHVELCIAFQYEQWYRVSINKKTATLDAKTNKLRWFPGTVHCKPIDAQTLCKYTLLKIPVARSEQARAVQFLEAQIGAPFNYTGYLLNGLIRAHYGPRRFTAALLQHRSRFYCSQLVCCLLQAVRPKRFDYLDACLESPNSLYRKLHKFFPHTLNPVTSV